MQVFITNPNLKISSQELDDTHLNKQITEINQILLTYINQNIPNPYHKHPVNTWYKSNQGISFLLTYLEQLCQEYKYRFNKYHMGFFTLIGLKNYFKTIHFISNPNFTSAYIKGQKNKNQIIDPSITQYEKYQNLLNLKYQNPKIHYKWTSRSIPIWVNKKKEKE